ncbi:MAG: peptide chain release factor N(5)-glutamine methyltransferase [Desulfovibrio sp.]|uniref:peptide chain release factor N(5)-glutamine methyltransferase n=1 Tax=Desulfovibrio sp. 7SRBS1 TaxID=3378064 RepID=UPI003B3D0C5D
MRLRELLQQWEGRLNAAGVDSPRLSVQLLASHVLGKSRVDMLLDAGQEVEEAKREEIERVIARRHKGEPVAYILGEKEFYGLPFAVGPGVLVPRPETELIVDKVRELYTEDEPLVVADFGAGSGALAVTLAKVFPRALVVAVELSPDAIHYIIDNAKKNGVRERVLTVRADFCRPVLRRESFDVVVSNPPYICRPQYDELSAEVREYEPQSALTPGETGLEQFDALARQACAALKDGGRFFMEIGFDQGETALKKITAAAQWTSSGGVQDLAGLDRVVWAGK